jgi:hypothetical protein
MLVSFDSVVWKASTGNICQLPLDHFSHRSFVAVQPQGDQPLQRLGVSRASLGNDLSRQLISRPLKHRRRSGDALGWRHRIDSVLIREFDR